MALETGTYISDLVTTNPPNTDGVAQADDHLRLIKSTVKATFPNITGAVTPTHTELNYVDGVTSAIQTQLDAKAPLASPTLTGVPAAPTAAVDTNTTQLATTAYVVGQGYLKSSTASSTYLTSATAASTYLPIAGTAAQAAKLSTTSGAWLGAQDSVVGMIGWKQYGNNHVVFDASAGTAPDGTVVNNTTPVSLWQASYPTLMGWNGINTHGVRVDSARVADSVPTSAVLNATAAGPAGDVGTYGFLAKATPSAGNPGDLVAGSALRWTNANGGLGTAPAGSWRLMGLAGTGVTGSPTLFLRYA